MEIINLTPNVGTLQDNTYTITQVYDYHNSVINFKLMFKDFIATELKVGCPSCTKGEKTVSKQGTEVSIKFTPSKAGTKGDFQKSFTLKNEQQQIKITFKGKTK